MKILFTIALFIVLNQFVAAEAALFRFSPKDGFLNKFTPYYLVDKHQRLWMATTGSGIRVFDGKQWTVYTTKNTRLAQGRGNGLLSDSVTAIGIDDVNSWLWVVTPEGICRMDMGTAKWTHFKGSNGPAVDFVRDVAIDHRGNAFFASYAGVVEFDSQTGKWRLHTPKEGLFDENIRHVQFAAGAIWAASRAGAVCRYNGSEWKTYVDY